MEDVIKEDSKCWDDTYERGYQNDTKHSTKNPKSSSAS